MLAFVFDTHVENAVEIASVDEATTEESSDDLSQIALRQQQDRLVVDPQPQFLSAANQNLLSKEMILQDKRLISLQSSSQESQGGDVEILREAGQDPISFEIVDPDQAALPLVLDDSVAEISEQGKTLIIEPQVHDVTFSSRHPSLRPVEEADFSGYRAVADAIAVDSTQTILGATTQESAISEIDATERLELDDSVEEISDQEKALIIEPQIQDVRFSSRYPSLRPEEELNSSSYTSANATATDIDQTIAQEITQETESSEIDEAKLFEQVFGHSQSSSAEQVEVPLLLNGRSQGSILVYPHNEADRITVAASTFLSLVKDSVSETIQSNLQSAVISDDRLSLLVLQGEGLAVHFDRRRLELYVDIPPDLRSMAINSIDGATTQPDESLLTSPAQLSGYLNLRGNQTINWADKHTKLEPPGLQFDGAINWQGWVLETYGQATLGQSWQLDRLSVVRDAPDQAIRYTFGDLSVPTTGYQTSPSLFGVSAARDFSLQPFRVARPTSNYSFFLERTSVVKVFVNDELTTTLRLEAGPQDIRDLPLKVGINDIRLEITNDLGQEETLNFSTGVAGELLAKGMHQFAYSTGFPTVDQQPLKSYDLSRPTLSMFHRVGLTSDLTLGGYLQGDTTQQMVGLNGTWATTVGNFGWDMAASNHSDYGVDIAGKFFYQWLEASQKSSQNRQLQVALEYRGKDFSILGQDTPQNSNALNFAVAYRQTLFENVQARFNGEYQVAREGDNAYNIGVNLSRPLGQGLNLNLSYQYGQDSSRQTNHRFSMGFSGALPFNGQRFNTRTEFDNTLEPQNTFNWTYSPNHALGSIIPDLTLTQSSDSYGLNGRLQYQGYRSSFELNHQFILPRDQEGSIGNSSTVTWGTAIAFVDGVWGWSRPIDNSFALVTRQGSATGETVRVNPTLLGDMAQANRLGPAVLSVAPYNLTQVSLDAPDLSLGEDLGQTSYQLLPTYRSGTLITTGTE
ncbi:MAG: fimbrial biogenesis outer membrane usher protein, partial [Leptolyngbya sp. SIO3F4]|nr:fimbrial biogenesis outer membrane usher protein [Leptolyngbya sp. SIO3F4]